MKTEKTVIYGRYQKTKKPGFYVDLVTGRELYLEEPESPIFLGIGIMVMLIGLGVMVGWMLI